MEDLSPWIVWVGMFATPVISLLKKSDWAAEVKQLVALFVCVVASLIVSIFANIDSFSWDYFVTNLAVIFTTTQVFYTQLFEGTSKEETLRKIDPYKE